MAATTAAPARVPVDTDRPRSAHDVADDTAHAKLRHFWRLPAGTVALCGYRHSGDYPTESDPWCVVCGEIVEARLAARRSEGSE